MKAQFPLSVVVASRDRPDLIGSLARDLASQERIDAVEVVVVDDGSDPPLADDVLKSLPNKRLIRTAGVGPARARNVGWRAAIGEVVLFTDDDVRLGNRWVAAALDAFHEAPELVALEGPVTTRPWDPLLEYTVHRDSGGWGLTCNVAYRRSALEQVSGFDESFPFPHMEDLDLWLRIAAGSRARFSNELRVDHPPRRMAIKDHIRRARWIRSDVRMQQLHPEIFGEHRRTLRRLAPLWSRVHFWLVTARPNFADVIRRPARVAFWVAAAAGSLTVASVELSRCTLRRAAGGRRRLPGQRPWPRRMANRIVARLDKHLPERTRAAARRDREDWAADLAMALSSGEFFAGGSDVPEGYGVGTDERVVEFPWILQRLPHGRILDAGSSLNHPPVLDRVLDGGRTLDIVTLAPEEQSYPERTVSYLYADLRALPLRDGLYDAVVCLSVLEHVGMDNRIYGAPYERSSNPDAQAAAAMREMNRVLAPGGELLLTVPFGRRMDLGWVRQFDADSLRDAMAAFDGEVREVVHYRAGNGGWRLADATDLHDVSFAGNHAAAVACVRLAKPT